MKLQSSKQKQKKMIIIIAVAILAVALIVGLVIGVVSVVQKIQSMNQPTPEMPSVPVGINVSRFPDKTEYMVGEGYDWTGLKVQLVMSRQSETRFLGVDEVEITGFDSSAVNDRQVITVTYGEFSTSFTIKIKEAPSAAPKMVAIKLDDTFKSSYSMNEWNNTSVLYGVYIVCVYSDGSESQVLMEPDYIVGGALPKATAPGEVQFEINYKGLEVIITVTITE